jgi:hypothetical protein
VGQTASSTAMKNAKALNPGTNEALFPEHNKLNFTKRGAYLWPGTQLLSFSKRLLATILKK